jgi:type I restriction enzyme S subunit
MSKRRGLQTQNDDSSPAVSRPPKNWTTARLDEVCSIAIGFAFKSAEFAPSGIPLLRGENIEPGALRWRDVRYWPPDKLEGFRQLLVEEGDVILAMDRPIISSGLKLAVARPTDVPCLLVQRVARIRSADPSVLRYVHYALQTPSFVRHLVQGQTGTQLPHISGKSIQSFRFPLAPLLEQGRIVAAIEANLTRLDAGVAGLVRVRAKLRRYRAAVLKAACDGRLVPTEAELARAEGRDYEPADRLLDRILKERRARWEADQLAKLAGESAANGDPSAIDPFVLPRGWTLPKVGEVGAVQLGRQRSPKHHHGPHMRPYLRVANVFEDRIDTSDVLEMNFTPREFETYRLESGDILLNEGQSLELVGRPAMYRGEAPGACFQNTLVRFRSGPAVEPSFALLLFRHYLHAGIFQRIAKWTVNIAHLGAGRFSELPFPLPPLEEQRRIVAEVERRLSLVDEFDAAIAANLKRAERLRQSILKRAFEGKLVPQDPADEPADALLKRLRGTRCRQGTIHFND